MMLKVLRQTGLCMFLTAGLAFAPAGSHAGAVENAINGAMAKYLILLINHPVLTITATVSPFALMSWISSNAYSSAGGRPDTPLSLYDLRNKIKNEVLSHYRTIGDEGKVRIAEKLFEQIPLADYQVITPEFVTLNIDTKVSLACEYSYRRFEDDPCNLAQLPKDFISKILPYRSGRESMADLVVEIKRRVRNISKPLNRVGTSQLFHTSPERFCNHERWLGKDCMIMWSPYLPGQYFALSGAANDMSDNLKMLWVPIDYPAEFASLFLTLYPFYTYDYSVKDKEVIQPYHQNNFTEYNAREVREMAATDLRPLRQQSLKVNKQELMYLCLLDDESGVDVPIYVIRRSLSNQTFNLVPGRYAYHVPKGDENPCEFRSGLAKSQVIMVEF